MRTVYCSCGAFLTTGLDVTDAVIEHILDPAVHPQLRSIVVRDVDATFDAIVAGAA